MRSLACVCLLMLTGCGGGPSLYSVSGTVTLDGKTVEGLMVAFAPTERGMSGAGRTDASGKYTITCTQGRGLPSGTYNVAIQEVAVVDNSGADMKEVDTGSNSAAYEKMAQGDMNQYKIAERNKKDRIPAKYNSKTTLQEIVAETDNTIDFKLSSK